VSFFSRKVAIDELVIERPAVVVRIGEDGHSNVPTPGVPQQTPAKPWRQRLFDLAISRLRLDNGFILFNDVRIPLVAEGENFRFALDLDAPAPGRESYVGSLSWQHMDLVARRYLPFHSDIAAKFTLTRQGFSLDELRWKLPRSEFQVRAELPSFGQSDWNLHYRGQLALTDLRTILRKPHVPFGTVEFSGQGSYAGGEWTAEGHYAGHKIDMPYEWFHTNGIESGGRFQVANRHVQVPQFEAHVLGGRLAGRMEMDFHGLAFRVESQARGVNLAALLGAADNRNFPMHTFHWDGSVDVDSVTTWAADFKHFRSRGESRWLPPQAVQPGTIPTSARLDFDYSMDARGVALTQSEISTPSTHIEMDGTLGAEDSALEVKLDAQNLLDWDDFINFLRGTDAEPRRIAGRATWRGRVLGPLGGPTFSGHVQAYDARYDTLAWDEVVGDMNYSPDEFHLSNARVRRGHSTAGLDLRLQFDGAWSFLPESPWSLVTTLDRAPIDDVQGLFGTNFPAHGLLTGEFRASGTRANPEIDGDFQLTEVDAWGVQLDNARGEIHVGHDEISIRNAELRRNQGSVAGNFLYRPSDRTVDLALTGSGIALDRIKQLQFAALPIGGRVDFRARGHGPMFAPTAQGTIRLLGLRIGNETQGDFEGRLDSDGKRLRVELNSLMSAGNLQGQIEVGLGNDYPLTGEVIMEKIDLDPFIKAGLHLKALTGHSSVDGRFLISGALRRPGSTEVKADISRVSLDYEFVKLENAGPFRLSYRRDEVRVEQARFHGPNTDFGISGSVRFTGDRALHLNLNGTVNLRLLTGLFPSLEARGSTEVAVAIEGTYSSPRITGKARFADAAANYGDFPAGLSHVTGELVFDSNRLLFDGVTAEAGGGALRLSGSLNYGDGPARYEISASAKRVRIRYPEGMSWLVGGTLRLSGTPQAGVLSGHILVDRLLLGEGVDLASLIVVSREPVHGPSTTSAFLRDLQFDITVDSSPDARLEWTGANVQTEGNLRVRVTWEHPILLGHIHLLSGEMDFRGNRFTLSRGDINFANPFRLDPALNVEATTTIRQYEITLDFTGPASHLSLAYRSDPPLPSGDIIALLALGTTSQESALRSSGTTAGGQNYGATTLLSEAVSSQLGGRIEHIFGISRFRVDPFLAGTTTEQNAAARVTIEKQVTHDLTVTYSSNTTSDQEQVIQVEYSLRRDVSIIALRDNNGTFGLDVKFTKRFK
jgi:translocation and assembly module TamB